MRILVRAAVCFAAALVTACDGSGTPNPRPAVKPGASEAGITDALAGPTLTVDKPSIELSATLGADGTNSHVDKREVLELGCSDSEQSVLWEVVSSPSWISVSAVKGGTPASLELTFDLDEMSYGVNDGELLIKSGGAHHRVSATYEVTGALVLSPDGGIGVTVPSGMDAPVHTQLQLSSPGKDLLGWRASCEDPWISLSATKGVTPATITISVDGAQLAGSVTSRLVIEADHTVGNARTVVAVAMQVIDVLGVQTQLDAQQKLLASEDHDLAVWAADQQRQLVEEADVATMKMALSTFRARCDERVEKLTTMADALEGLLTQHEPHAEFVKLADARSQIETVRLGGRKLKALVATLSDGVSVESVDVSASAEWQRSGLRAKNGDVVVFQATGRWNLGFMAGSAGPDGQVRKHPKSVDPRFGHGALLIRAGEEEVVRGAERGAWRIRGDGGLISLRCNDVSTDDNSGRITVTIARIPYGAVSKE